MLKLLKLPHIRELLTVKIDAETFIFINTGNFYYTKLPHNIYIKWSFDTRTVLIKTNLIYNEEFDKLVSFLVSSCNNPSCKFKIKMRLKGLGYRVWSNDSGFLEFKLGYSHLCRILLPDAIKVRVLKTSLTFESSDKVLLGNLTRRIFLLKKPDVYKNKGFSYKYQNIIKKIIKKK